MKLLYWGGLHVEPDRDLSEDSDYSADSRYILVCTLAQINSPPGLNAFKVIGVSRSDSRRIALL